MSNTYFQFRQFRIEQDRCAMKVTTDACILGAWTPLLPAVHHVLDIGAGTGLLPLMLAQRSAGMCIDAIELDADAARQAKENVEGSGWKERINVVKGDARDYVPEYKYDLIITNPPFFNNSLLSGNLEKDTARHTISLSYNQLLKVMVDNLSEEGYSAVLLPSATYPDFRKSMSDSGLYEFYRLWIAHTASSAPKRVIMLLGKKRVQETIEEKLVIMGEQGGYSAEFTALLAPFYLNL